MQTVVVRIAHKIYNTNIHVIHRATCRECCLQCFISLRVCMPASLRASPTPGFSCAYFSLVTLYDFIKLCALEYFDRCHVTEL